MKRSPLHTDTEKVREFQARGRKSSAKALSTRRPISPASPAQRAKVADRCCVNCGGSPCDPAHLAARSMGGCDDPLCVIPLCRTCHTDFDHGSLDLEPVLALREFAAERSHMASHLTLRQCMQRLTGERQAA